jgi:hypothetical protein
MGATSVTGVGQGSAAGHGKGNKGSEHMSLAVHRLIGPRVVACGDVVLDQNGEATVYYPTLPGGAELYCPFLSHQCPDEVPCWGSFTVSSFTVSGSEEASVCWQIVKKGLWGSLSNDGPQSAIANT